MNDIVPIKDLKPLENLGFDVVNLETLELPTVNRFSPGVYVREIMMPAGSIVIGRKHKTRHLNIVKSGKAALIVAGEMTMIDEHSTFESAVGARKCLYILEDMVYITIHPNPDNVQDIHELDEMFVDDSVCPFEELEVRDDLMRLKGEYLK